MAETTGITGAQKKMLYTAVASALIALSTAVTNSLTRKDPEVAATAVASATVAPYAIRVGQQVQRLTETVNQLNTSVALLQAEQNKLFVQVEIWKATALVSAAAPSSRPAHATRPPTSPSSTAPLALASVAPPVKAPVPAFDAILTTDQLMQKYQLQPQQQRQVQVQMQMQQQFQQPQE